MTKIAEDLISRFLPSEECNRTNAFKVAVIGGGPAGLLLAWKLLNFGHEVTVFEKRKAYELNQSRDSRSYNLTADGLGLRAFGRLSNLIYCAGIIVDGRAIHSSSSSTWTHPYGHRACDHLISIPREDMLALLAETIKGHKKCELHFESKVFDTKVKKTEKEDQGTVQWENLAEKGTKISKKGFDLIAFADGVHGQGLKIASRQPGNSMIRETEDTPYINLTISREIASKAQMELNKIHFFPSEESLAIGLPNFDGTISLLIEGRIRKNHKGKSVCPFTARTPFDFNKKVFKNRNEVNDYLERQNPTLNQILAGLPDDQFLDKLPGHFIESSITNWRVGDIGVLVGDAGSCAPPWAGFGMNLACSHAADLAQLINKSSDIDSVLDKYNERRIECTKVVKRIIQEHGTLLNSGMGSRKWRREQELRDRREQILGERSEYQIVAFHEFGLEDLAKLE